MSGSLSPCPFCGESSASVDEAGDMPLGHGQYQNLFVVHCGCGVEGTTCNTPAVAIEAWNRRASPPPQATGAPQWLPIESAPIDKPLILGATGWVEQGWWDDDRGEWYAVNTHWTDAHGGCLYPTHWQPLPAAPQVENKNHD